MNTVDFTLHFSISLLYCNLDCSDIQISDIQIFRIRDLDSFPKPFTLSVHSSSTTFSTHAKCKCTHTSQQVMAYGLLPEMRTVSGPVSMCLCVYSERALVHSSCPPEKLRSNMPAMITTPTYFATIRRPGDCISAYSSSVATSPNLRCKNFQTHRLRFHITSVPRIFALLMMCCNCWSHTWYICSNINGSPC